MAEVARKEMLHILGNYTRDLVIRALSEQGRIAKIEGDRTRQRRIETTIGVFKRVCDNLWAYQPSQRIKDMILDALEEAVRSRLLGDQLRFDYQNAIYAMQKLFDQRA